MQKSHHLASICRIGDVEIGRDFRCRYGSAELDPENCGSGDSQSPLMSPWKASTHITPHVSRNVLEDVVMYMFLFSMFLKCLYKNILVFGKVNEKRFYSANLWCTEAPCCCRPPRGWWATGYCQQHRSTGEHLSEVSLDLQIVRTERHRYNQMIQSDTVHVFDAERELPLHTRFVRLRTAQTSGYRTALVRPRALVVAKSWFPRVDGWSTYQLLTARGSFTVIQCLKWKSGNKNINWNTIFRSSIAIHKSSIWPAVWRCFGRGAHLHPVHCCPNPSVVRVQASIPVETTKQSPPKWWSWWQTIK